MRRDVVLVVSMAASAAPAQVAVNSSTALQHAAARGHEGAVAMLLAAGATAAACDEDGCTALHYAVCAFPLRVSRNCLMQSTDRYTTRHALISLNSC